MTTTSASKHHRDHDGQTFYFCSALCEEKFDASPTRYLTDDPPAGDQQVSLPGAIYVCPMDLEIRQVGPGTCPKCGMALELETPLTPTKHKSGNRSVGLFSFAMAILKIAALPCSVWQRFGLEDLALLRRPVRSPS